MSLTKKNQRKINVGKTYKTSTVFGHTPQSGEEHWPKDRLDNEEIDRAIPTADDYYFENIDEDPLQEDS